MDVSTIGSVAQVDAMPHLWVVAGLGTAIAMVLVKLVDKAPPRVSKECRKCQYDRAGLADESPCPECNSREVSIPALSAELRLRLPLLKEMAVPIVVVVFLFLMGDRMVAWLVLPGYLRDGYDLETSLRVIPNREGADGWLSMLYPLAMCACVAVVAAALRPRKLAWAVIVVILLVGILLCIPNIPW